MDLAVFGLGPWGLTYLAALGEVASAKVVAVCDPDPAARALASVRAPGVRVFAREIEAIAWMTQRAGAGIVVATPIDTHAALAVRALDAGIGVLVEKPLAASWADADRLARHPAAGKLGAVGHLLLHHPAIQEVRAASRAGRLGRLRRVGTLRTSQRSSTTAGGGTPEIWHLAPHDVAIVLELAGCAPQAVRVTRDGDLLRVDLAFASIEATLRLARGRERSERSLAVEGTEATACFDEVRGTLRLRDEGERVFRADVLRLQCEAFVRQLRDGTPPEVSFRSGRDVVACLEAAESSLAHDGRWVDLDEASEGATARVFSREPGEETRRAG